MTLSAGLGLKGAEVAAFRSRTDIGPVVTTTNAAGAVV
jgi:hypothetical protein